MNKISKISNLFIYFLVTYLFISVTNEQSSGISSFYYFEKPQEDGIEKFVDVSNHGNFNFKSFLSKTINKSIQNFDISGLIDNSIIEVLTYESMINNEYSAILIPIHTPTINQKIITKVSTDLPNIMFS